MIHFLTFFGCWVVGAVLLFFWLKNQNKALTFNDVMLTSFISAGIGLVFSYAAWQANILNWFSGVAFIALSAFISNKLLEKSKN